MRYSAPLVAALAQVCPDRSFTLLVSPEGADPDSAIPGVEIDRAIRVPLPLARYRWPALGIIDRCVHWGRADRQILAWLCAHPDVRFIHYQDSYGLATLRGLTALRKLGIRSLLTVHNVRPHGFAWWQPAFLKNRIDRSLFRHFDALLVHSESLKRTLTSVLGANAPPIYVVPHGVGETLRPGELAPLRERMMRRQLLFVGAPRPNKGLPLLLEALRLLPEFSLTLAGTHGGDIRYGEHIRTLIAGARAGGCRIDVKPGFVPDEHLDLLLRSHSAVMLPYNPTFHAQSGVLSQAISYGVPVVATDVGAVGETVRQFGLGCVVEPQDAAAFARGVRQLYELDPNQLAIHIAHAAEALAWTAVASALSKVYDRI